MIVKITLVVLLLITLPMLAGCQIETDQTPPPESSSPPTTEQPPSSTPDTTMETPDTTSPDPNPSAGEDYKFTGVIESTGNDVWVIGGQTFKVDENTELDSGLSVGVSAKVEYVILTDGTKLALEIETP